MRADRRATAVRVLVATALVATFAAPAHSQTIVGRVLDDTRETPVAEALVRLLDRDGEEQGQALSDASGRFTLTPPGPGEYYLEATRIGYERTTTPLLALTAAGSAPLELMMQPAPIGLEGFAVAVDAVSRAEDELQLAGIEPRDMGNRFIGLEKIEAVNIKRDPGSILEWNPVSGVQVLRPENTTTGSDNIGLCVTFNRTRTMGRGRCAMIVWNGVQMDQIAALDLDPETIGAMAVLSPIEAVVLFGKRGEAGAVMMWTRQGRSH